MLISNTAIRNRTTVLVFVILIIFSGLMSYVTLPRESAPDVKIPYILISTANQGVAPKDIENEITNEIEQKLTGLKGVKEITSSSSEGFSMITVEFLPDVDIDVALQRVKDKVDLAKPELPKNTDEPVEPVISEINLSEMPILMISMTGHASPLVMKQIAEDLEEELEAIPGVLEVDVMGALEREIVVEIDPDRFAKYQLSVVDMFTAITGEHLNQTAGGLETEGVQFNVRIPAEVREPGEIQKFPLTHRGQQTIYLNDVAEIKDTFKDRSSYSRLDGKTSITLAVKKRSGANIIDIANHVKAVLKQAKTMVPTGVTFELTLDQSKEIDNMIADLENNIMTGLVLVVTVLIAFMGLRSSMIVATAIPLSMLMSFAVIQMLGLTLNMVVLFALILSLGMLVDNAIVIVENIYRYMEMGFGRVEAAMKGTGEVAWPVIASTATTVAAFSPLLFWPGVMGDFMKFVPLTVIIVLICSLVVAMVINPVICSLVAKPGKQRTSGKRESKFLQVYRRLLNGVLHRPLTTIFASICLLVAIGLVYQRRGAGMELFPEIDPNQGVVNIRCPQGTNIKETNRLADLIEQRVMPYRTNAQKQNQYDNLVTNVGTAGGGGGWGGSSSGKHTADLTMVFPDYEDRVIPSADIIAEIRKEVMDIPGAEIKVVKQEEGPPTGQAVTVRFIGEDLKVLQEISENAKKRIKNVPNLVNLQSDMESAKPELQFIPDRKRAGRLGVNTRAVSEYLKAAIFGTKVSTYRQFNDEYDIRIRLPLEQREQLDDLLRWRIPTATGKAVPISSLGRFEYRPGLGTIHRLNRKRVVTLTADAEGRLGDDVLKDVQKILAEMKLPTGYRLEYAGEKEEQDEAQAFVTKAFAIAVLLIVMILVAQFNTLSAPLIIMTTVLLSMIGVFVGLLAFDMPFGVVMTGVGVISLAGVVVNNAIVLLDYTRQLQKRGRPLLEAAVEAGVTRLRPVMLTATTTVLGLIPMVTGVSFDFHTFSWATRSSSSQWWSSMAVAVVFGLAFATMLTLLVVPSLYVLLYRLAERMGFGGLKKPEDVQHPHSKPVLEDY